MARITPWPELPRTTLNFVQLHGVPVKAGTQERGTVRGTERGTEVKCGPRAIITCTGPYAQGVFIHWTGLDSPKNLFFSVGQKLSILIYSLKLLA